jgi:hypothetical protein
MPESIHCPIANSDILSENPKPMQRRIASGSIPLPLSVCQCQHKIKVTIIQDKKNYIRILTYSEVRN